MKFLAAVLVAASALATACDLLPRRFSVTLPENPDVHAGAAVALPVMVDDHTGLIVNVEPAGPRQGRGLSVSRHPTSPTALIVTWPGGACEREAVLKMSRTQAGYRLTLREALNEPCVPAPAVRELHLILSQPVDPAEIEFVPEGGLIDAAY